MLGHNVLGEAGRRIFRKGRVLSQDDVEQLLSIGKSSIYIAEFDESDVAENEAGLRITTALTREGLRRSDATTGRVNVYAEHLGLLRVDEASLLDLNLLDGVALATKQNCAVVQADEMVANLKIVPYALTSEIVDAALAIASKHAILQLAPLKEQHVGLILTGSASSQDKTVRSFVRALEPRLNRLNAQLSQTLFIALENDSIETELAAAIWQFSQALGMVLVAGDTAIMDRWDIVPQAVESAGGEVVGFGAPVDPGNLFMLGYLGKTAVVGVPGCARNPNSNLVDLILPRLLVGEPLTRRDIAMLGHGGLLE